MILRSHLKTWIVNVWVVFIVSFFILGAEGKDVCIELTARFATLAPDGVSKEVITINDQFPGPTIRAQIGDRVSIRVNNQLIDRNGKRHPTSVHFHGIEMRGTPWMDGPEQVTQCPIPFDGHMVYSFTLHQLGTYWYHSHHSWQYIDGFWGFLIVDNQTLPDDGMFSSASSLNESELPISSNAHMYDDELQISLMDWHWRSGSVLTKILHLPLTSSWDNFEASQPPIPDSALINGWGNANCTNATSLGYHCDDNVSALATVFNVIPCFTYRIRVLNPSARASFKFSIPGHKLRVIEVDGVDTVEVAPVDQVRIWPAQRYSFLVAMDMNTVEHGDYAWIQAPLVIEGPPEHDHLVKERLPHIQPLAALRYMKGDRPESIVSSCLPPAIEEANNELSPASQERLDNMVAERRLSIGGGGQGRVGSTQPGLQEHDSLEKHAADSFTTEAFDLPTPTCQFVSIEENMDKSQARMRGDSIPASPTLVPIPDPISVLNQSLCYPMDKSGTSTETVPQPQNGNGMNISIHVKFHRDEYSYPQWLVNNGSYSTEGVHLPAIFWVMQKRPVPESFVPFHVPLGRVVDLVIYNQDGFHPYHLHGHTFWVLGIGDEGDGPFDPSNHVLDTVQGVKRDTVHVSDNSWAVLRFETDNPGVWLLHCHIHWHFDHGFAMVFIEGEEELPKIPEESRRVCAANDVLA